MRKYDDKGKERTDRHQLQQARQGNDSAAARDQAPDPAFLP